MTKPPAKNSCFFLVGLAHRQLFAASTRFEMGTWLNWLPHPHKCSPFLANLQLRAINWTQLKDSTSEFPHKSGSFLQRLGISSMNRGVKRLHTHLLYIRNVCNQAVGRRVLPQNHRTNLWSQFTRQICQHQIFQTCTFTIDPCIMNSCVNTWQCLTIDMLIAMYATIDTFSTAIWIILIW